MTAPFPDPALMPPPSPLDMPAQDLSRATPANGLPRDRWTVQAARAFVFGFGLGVSGVLGLVMLDWFRPDGISWIEASIIACGMFTVFWIALSVATALLGCLPHRARPAPKANEGLDIAMVMPIYGEPLGPILQSARAMLDGVIRANTKHSFAFYLLSDTRDPAQVQAETRAVARLRAVLPGAKLFYRNRPENRRYKAGNLQDWVIRWGGAHDAMLVLDADSYMETGAILALCDAMTEEPRLGLVQSVPRLIGATSVFARMQAFGNEVYGTTLSRGLSLWSGTAANYWGHNALIRIPAFAAHAGLPDLPGRRPFGGVILSHDFVEAALLRRAGWQVRFLPEARGSFETTPETLVGHVMRDRRWCQGNLQHLSILSAQGLHPISRMHMVQGAMSYCTSILWFALMALWVLVGIGAGDGAIKYFSEANPLFPAWPEMDMVSRLLIVVLIYGLLIVPKVLGALMFWLSDPTLSRAGGPVRFLGSFFLEVGLSILLAPTMMIQHMIAVCRTLSGRDTGWKPADRTRPGLFGLLRFHATELFIGAGMVALFTKGVLTVWLLPIGIMLIAAPLLSWLVSLCPRWATTLFVTEQDHLSAEGEPSVAAAA